MSTNNISDEELDDLFRKTAENLDPPFDPEAWKEMETKLNSTDTGNPNWKKLLYALLLLVGIGSVVGVYHFAQAPEKETTAITENNQAREREQHLITRTQTATTQKPLQQEQQNPAAVQTDRNTKAATASARTKAGMAGDGYTTFKKKKTGDDRKTKTNVIKTKTETPAPAATASGSIAKRNPVASDSANITPGATVAANTPELQNPGQPAATTAVAIPDIVQAPVTAYREPETAQDSITLKPENKGSSAFLRSAQVILLFAPDVTTVKFHNPNAISTNAGIVVGLALTKKISLVSGAVWANKIYGADPAYYEPANDYWYGKKLPNTIDATCKVLDIPLNIRYQLLERNKNSFAVQAGVSSYFMLEEKYTYNYTNYSKSYTYSNQNTHWFGVQNVSVSYNRKLARGFTAGVEPFLKFPLTGIGAGNVKLTSAGIFFTAGYTLSLRK